MSGIDGTGVAQEASWCSRDGDWHRYDLIVAPPAPSPAPSIEPDGTYFVVPVTATANPRMTPRRPML